MTHKQLFHSLQYLDDALVEITDRPANNRTVWLRWGAAAAAFVLVAGAVLALPRLRSEGGPQMGGGTEANWTEPPQSAAGEPQPGGVPGRDAAAEAPKPAGLAWNELDGTRGSIADVAGVMMVGEPLTAEQTADCAPEIREAWMAQFNGNATYYLNKGAGGLAWIELTVQNFSWGGSSTIRLRDKNTPEQPSCYVRLRETDRVESYNGQEYRAYRFRYFHGEGNPTVNPPQPWTEMTVIFEKENVEYTLSANVPQTQEELAAADLRDLLLCYAGTHSAPDLSAFRCGEHVYRDEELTFAEALADPDFGAYLPATEPEGFALEMLRRYQLDDSVNFMNAFWFKPHGDLKWMIKSADAETLARVVDPSEPERYDWNRYPVPWTAYAAQENWLTIENPVFRIGDLTPELIATRIHTGDEGSLMFRFCVLFESGIVIEINAKDVPAEWLYENLMRIVK